jgi:hypothetical protein
MNEIYEPAAESSTERVSASGVRAKEGLSQSNISLTSEESRKTAYLQFQKQLEDRLNELKADLTERPFLWLAIAFIAGVVSQTFPIRVLLQVVLRVVFWLAGPTILLMGVIKISDLFSSARRNAPTIPQRP